MLYSGESAYLVVANVGRILPVGVGHYSVPSVQSQHSVSTTIMERITGTGQIALRRWHSRPAIRGDIRWIAAD
jgi:hypothetical protein